MHGLGVIEGMTMSGHPWIINEIIIFFQATVTHTDGDDKSEMDLVWSPPSNAAPGTEYYFHYTIVKNYGNIWVGRDSPVFSFE